MTLPTLTAATWPSDPDIRPRRRALQLLVGLTDQLHALAHGHLLLTRLVEQPDRHTADTLLDTLREIDQVIVTPTDSMALLDLARHHRHVHQLLRDGFGHRTDALIGLRRLTAPQSFTPGLTVPIDYHHARAVLEHTLALLDHAGRALTRADSMLVGELTAAIQTPTAPQPRPRKRS